MKLKAIVLAATVVVTSSLAIAQPAPIGSSADSGNGALINRGPVRTTGEDMDFRTDRSSHARVGYPRHTRAMKHSRRHVAYWR